MVQGREEKTSWPWPFYLGLLQRLFCPETLILLTRWRTFRPLNEKFRTILSRLPRGPVLLVKE